LKVESEDKFERIGGSSIGGGTFWGLGALLTKTKVVHFVIFLLGIYLLFIFHALTYFEFPSPFSVLEV